MVECIEPFKGKVYDPACGSGGMFIQSMKFVEEHQGNLYNIGIYGQEKIRQHGVLQNEFSNKIDVWRLRKICSRYFYRRFTQGFKSRFYTCQSTINLEWDRDKVEGDPRWKYGLAPKIMPIMHGYNT